MARFYLGGTSCRVCDVLGALHCFDEDPRQEEFNYMQPVQIGFDFAIAGRGDGNVVAGRGAQLHDVSYTRADDGAHGVAATKAASTGWSNGLAPLGGELHLWENAESA